MIPELEALTPGFIGQQFSDAAPGHRFLLYFNYWEAGKFTPYKDARLPDIKHLDKAEKNRIRTEFEKRKNRAIGDVCSLPKASSDQITALRRRQQSLIQHYSTDSLHISAQSTAPFATGLGNEHPIENGFAFLAPYGLPYLAGSGVKGIVRRAMQELELEKDGEDGFTQDAINALFGPENIHQPEDAKRGALDFWDVFPKPHGDKLVVEIMTPHYSKYYDPKKGESPHDAGQPVPVSFLAVPAKSEFDFFVVCQPQRLPEHLRATWRSLLGKAFAHAFDWVGFGAKTAVGYGAMQETLESKKQAEALQHAEAQRKEQQERAARRAAMNPLEQFMDTALQGRSDKNQPELACFMGLMKQGKVPAELVPGMAQHLKELLEKSKKWKEKSEKKNPEKDGDYQDTLKVKQWLNASQPK